MELQIQIQNVILKGDLKITDNAVGLVIFAYGSGNGCFNSRNIFMAEELNMRGLTTLLFDLLTEEEKENKFNIELLTERLIGVTKWCMEKEETKRLRMGYLGESIGSAAALSAAAYWGTKIGAVVSRGGRPDLAMEELDLIEAPILLIVGGNDKEDIDFNRKAYVKIGGVKKMEIVPGTTHLFEEPGAMEKVASLAGEWFSKHLIKD
jgi:putative phosphoribosyl transferase